MAHMRHLCFALLGFGLLSLPLPAAPEPAKPEPSPRTWKNESGSSSFTGTYVSHNSTHLTVRRSDGKTFTFERSKLHPDDRAWLDQFEKAALEAESPPNAVFDTLQFGDDRATVERKLKESRFIQPVDESEVFFGRTGLNGSYRTREKIGGLVCGLYFDWTPRNTLREISLHSDLLPVSDYQSRLRDNWQALAELLSNVHGKPLQAAPYPDISRLGDDMFLASHLWRLENGGSALLGTSKEAGRCRVVVRFTTEKIEPVRISPP